MGLLKRKINSKRAGKGFFQIIVRQRKGTFFGKEVLREMCERAMPTEITEKGPIMQSNANNLYQRRLL
jgi:hypothetical protein